MLVKTIDPAMPEVKKLFKLTKNFISSRESTNKCSLLQIKNRS